MSIQIGSFVRALPIGIASTGKQQSILLSKPGLSANKRA
jgi:hypothetical protein